MNKKRFRVEKQIFDGYCIVDNTVDGYCAYEKQDLQRLCDSLNELADENEQLKKQIGNLEHTRDFCAECCERLEKENEELKSEIRKMQRAYEQLWMHTYR